MGLVLGTSGDARSPTLYFRVVDSPESKTQFLDELNWHVRNGRPHSVFDTR